MPTQLGRYRILKHLATGGMAEVFLAQSSGIEGFQRHVVLKRIHTEQATNAQFVQMFLDEARLAASLHHHNIVQVHDIGQEAGEFFYAMEYVHGEDIRSLLRAVSKRKQKVPFEHIVTIVIGAAAGLHYAHEHRGPDRKPLGLVHRDVSPSNVIVDFDGNVKVLDFGIAKAAHRTTETKSGVLKGKVAYMSPEQCKGKSVDRRSDVYALGIVLYELTTARRLFKGESDFMTMSQIVAGKIPLPSTRRPDLPPELEGIIMAALAKEPGERYQSANELRLALEQFAAAMGLRTSSTALAMYMKELFGDKPEPWLVDGYVPPEDLTVDFDGAHASGVAMVSESQIEDFVNGQGSEPQSSPLVRARQKALKRGERVEDIEGLDDVEPARSPAHVSGTPMAWPTAPDAASVRPRRSGFTILLVAVLVVGGGAFAILKRPWESAETAQVTPASGSPTQPSVQPAPPEPAKAAASEPPAVPVEKGPDSAPAKAAEPAQPADEPAEAVTPTEVAQTKIKAPTGPAKRKVPTTTKTKTKTKTRAATSGTGSGSSWNPDTLLPE